MDRQTRPATTQVSSPAGAGATGRRFLLGSAAFVPGSLGVGSQLRGPAHPGAERVGVDVVVPGSRSGKSGV